MEKKQQEMKNNYIYNVWDMGFLGNYPNFQLSHYTHYTHISQIKIYNILQHSIKVLYILLNALSIKDISIISGLNINIVSKIIHREDRQEGLLDSNVIELISSNPNIYKIKKEGLKVLKELDEKYKQQEQTLLQQQTHEQTLREEIEHISSYIGEKYQAKILEKQQNGKRHISFDFNELARWNPQLTEALLDDPIETLKKIEIGVENHFDDKKQIKVRIKNLPISQRIKIGDIRVEHLRKMYAVEGIIKQRSSVRPKVTMIRYECPSCGNVIPVLQLGDTIKTVKCGCGRKGNMNEQSKEMVNIQSLKLEELPEQLDGRTDCQSITVILKDDLTIKDFQSYYNPGSRIRINGIIYEKTICKNREKNVLMELYVEANYVEPQEKRLVSTYSKEDLVEIKKLSKDEKIITKLCDSFLPDLVGINKQKLAVILSIVKGGNTKRDEIHCLFAGEPGLAKSEILKRVPTLFKTARYANGASSSSVGLTASVIKDEFTSGWSLQAGAVVMANEGIACIDEIDKMKEEEKNDLNECAEQGTVTINKAGISGSLQAKTTLIMASNPKHHIFSGNESLLKQLNLPFALITRFDLLFILRNTKDEMLERMRDVLDIDYDNLNTPISEDILVKYIMVARDYKPTLSKKIKDLIMEKMVLIRDYDTSGESDVPLTMRQLQAIVRLSTAFAKLRLSNKVESVDVESAWGLYLSTLHSIKGVSDSQKIEEEKVGQILTNYNKYDKCYISCSICGKNDVNYLANDNKSYCKDCLKAKEVNSK